MLVSCTPALAGRPPRCVDAKAPAEIGLKLFVAGCYAGLLAMAFMLLQATEIATEQNAAMVAQDFPGASAGRASKLLLERLTFGLYHGAEAARHDQASLHAALIRTEREVTLWSVGIAGLTLVPLGIAGWRWWGARQHFAATRVRQGAGCATAAQARLALHVCGCAAVFLVVGILAPLLTIVAHQEVAVLGRVVLSYETKSFADTVGSLVDSGNWPVAALLATFSLVIPTGKLALSAVALGPRGNLEFRVRAHWILHHLGRWSMTDVFVVAILVAFFASAKAEATTAQVGVGLYFFATHTLLAVLASALAPHPGRDPPD